MSGKPPAPDIDWEGIPAELRKIPQWLRWRFEKRDDRYTKVPFGHNGRRASSMRPSDWGSYEEVREAYEERTDYAGVGFVFTREAGIVGIDLDGAIDDDGNPQRWALEIIDELGSYTEITPSGRGFHILVRADYPQGRRGTKRGPIEIYAEGRFFTMTGRTLGPEYQAIEQRQIELDALLARLPQRQDHGERHVSITTREPTGIELWAMEHILKLATSGVNPSAPRFLECWEGSGDYPSPSEGDFALCHYLAEYTVGLEERGLDPVFLIDHLFRQSGRYRTKWERENYAGSTIGKALSHVEEPWPWHEWPEEESEPPGISEEVRDLADGDLTEATVNWELRSADEIEYKDQRFVEKDWIPLGEVTVLGGHSGLGKSTYLWGISAELSNGRLGGDLMGEPRSTLFFAGGEDSFETHIMPSFRASGGDPKRLVEFSVRDYDEDTNTFTTMPPTIPRWLGTLRDCLEKNPDIALAIIDPILAFSALEDANSAVDVRKMVHSLQRMAMACEVAVIVVLHFRKGAKDPSTAIAGSHQWYAAPRSVLLLLDDPDPDTTSERLLVVEKAQRSPAKEAGLGKRIKLETVEIEVPFDGGTAQKKALRTRFMGFETVDSRGLLNPPSANIDLKSLAVKTVANERLTELWQAWDMGWFDHLEVSPHTVKTVRKEMLDDGLIEKQGESRAAEWRKAIH